MSLLIVCFSLSSGRYSDVAPPHSYIDASDFKSPEELAKYIIDLETDPMKYLSYFWWQKFYRVRSNRSTYNRGAELAWVAMCDLCKKLNDPEEPAKVVTNFEEVTACDGQLNDWGIQS